MHRWMVVLVLVAVPALACPWDYETYFGREVVHRRFVDYLVHAKQTPELFTREDFLGRQVTLERVEALEGSKEAPPAGLIDEVRAVVAMLAVYGAGQVSHLWLALGNLAVEARLPRTAWAAWQRARTLGHPRAKDLASLQKRLERSLEAKWVPSPEVGRLVERLALPKDEGGWAGMERSDLHEHERFAAKWAEYERLERALVKGGLAFWTAAGAETLYREQVKLGLRCEARDEALPVEAGEPSSSAAVAVVRGLDLRASCPTLARAMDAALTREAEALGKEGQLVLPTRAPLEPLAAVSVRCGASLKAVAERARTLTSPK